MPSIEIRVDQDGWTRRIQIGLMSSEGFGFRLAGPKYNGSSTNLLSHTLTEKDVEAIQNILNLQNKE